MLQALTLTAANRSSFRITPRWFKWVSLVLPAACGQVSDQDPAVSKYELVQTPSLDDFVAFWFLSTPGTARVEKAHFEIRSYSGDPLFVRTLPRADSALFGMVDALGNRIYVASNSTFEIPLIHEFELRKLDP